MNNNIKDMIISFYKDVLSISKDKNYSKMVTGLRFSIPVPYLDFLDRI